MNIPIEIQKSIAQSIKQLFGHDVEYEKLGLQPTRKEFEGTYTFVTFPYLRVSKLKPEETGAKIGEFLVTNCSEVVDFNVVKGFLNLTISDHTWINLLNHVSSTIDFGFAPANGKSVMVEYSSPNTNKPLHLGHLRNNFLGFSILFQSVV